MVFRSVRKKAFYLIPGTVNGHTCDYEYCEVHEVAKGFPQ